MLAAVAAKRLSPRVALLKCVREAPYLLDPRPQVGGALIQTGVLDEVTLAGRRHLATVIPVEVVQTRAVFVYLLAGADRAAGIFLPWTTLVGKDTGLSVSTLFCLSCHPPASLHLALTSHEHLPQRPLYPRPSGVPISRKIPLPQHNKEARAALVWDNSSHLYSASHFIKTLFSWACWQHACNSSIQEAEDGGP